MNESDTPFYMRWKAMKRRCLNPNTPDYRYYGGRGIKICKEWHYFKNFKIDMFVSFNRHLKKHGNLNTTLDRIDVMLPYQKSNCKWATRLEQSVNQRRAKIANSKTLKEWSKITGIKYPTLLWRFNQNWPVKNLLEINCKNNDKQRKIRAL